MSNIYTIKDKKEFLNKENVKSALKNISIAKFEVYINDYIKKDLVIGEMYDIHKLHTTIENNLQNGIFQLLADNNIDYADLKEIFKINTLDLSLTFNIGVVSVWERIAIYNLEFKQRKNASYSNYNVKLIKKPNFEFINKNEIEEYFKNNGISLYDLIQYYFEKQKQKAIECLKKENEECLKKIESNTREILDFENSSL